MTPDPQLEKTLKCPDCRGRGYELRYLPTAQPGYDRQQIRCATCAGSGRVCWLTAKESAAIAAVRKHDGLTALRQERVRAALGELVRLEANADADELPASVLDAVERARRHLRHALAAQAVLDALKGEG